MVSYKNDSYKKDNKYYDVLKIYLGETHPMLFYLDDFPDIKDIHDKLITALKEL